MKTGLRCQSRSFKAARAIAFFTFFLAFIRIQALPALAATRVFVGLSTNLPPRWEDAQNWDKGVPSEDDDVIIGSDSQAFHVLLSGKVRLKSLRLTRSEIISTGSTMALGSLTCSGGAFQGGPFAITIADSAEIKTGAGGEPGIQLEGGITLTNSGSMNIAQNAAINFSDSLLQGLNQFVNMGVITFRQSAGISGSHGLVVNSRVLRADAASASVSLSPVTFQNLGTVEVLSGRLEFGVGGVLTGGGTWLTDSDQCTLVFNGAKLYFNEASMTGDGPVILQSSTLVVGNGVDLQTLAATDATIDGPGTLRLTGKSTWNGGTLQGTGAVSVAAKAEMQLTNNVFVLDKRTFDNLGQVTQNGSAILRLANGALFINAKDAVVTLANSGTSGFIESSGDAPGIFQNSGSLIVQAHTNQFNTTFQPVLQNSGVIFVNSTLTLNGGGTHTGIAYIDAPTNGLSVLLDFHAGTNFWENTSFHEGLVQLSGGTVAVTGEYAIADSLRLDGGVIDGAGKLLSDDFKWRFGTVQGSGSIETRSLSFEPMDGTRHWAKRKISFRGFGFWRGGDIDAGDGAALTINHGALFEIQCDQVWSTGAGSSLIENNGVLLKSGKDGTTTIVADFQNSGTLEENKGRVRFVKNFIQKAGKTIVAKDATLQFNVLTNDGTLGGNGIYLGEIYNLAKTSPGKSPGVLTVQGSYAQSATGQLDIELAGTVPGDSFDQLNVSGAATLDGSLNISLLNGFVPAPGDRFEVMRFTSRTGSFPVNNGFRLHDNFVLLPVYSSTNLVLVATNLTLITPTVTVALDLNHALQLGWETSPGGKYQVETSEDLFNWTVLTNLTASGTSFNLPVAVGSEPARFFRIR